MRRHPHACDAADADQVAALFAAAGEAEVVVYNPSYRTRGPVAELDPAEVQKSLQVCAFGGFLAVREAARRMLAAPPRSGNGARAPSC